MGEITIRIEDLVGIERIHLEFYGGLGVLFYPDPEAGLLKMAAVRWTLEGDYQSFTDTPDITEAKGNEELRVDSFWDEDTGMYVTPPWLSELDTLICVSAQPGRVEQIRASLQSILKNFGDRIKDISQSKYPDKVQIGCRIRIGHNHLAGFEGLILPLLRAIGVEKSVPANQ